MEQTDDLFTCLKPTGGFEASACRQMWCWLERRALHMWRVWWAGGVGCGWQRGPSFHLLRCCLSAKKGSGGMTERRVLARTTCGAGAWVWTVWIRKWFAWASKCARVCVRVPWSWEASTVPEANLTTAKVTASLRSWDSSCSETTVRRSFVMWLGTSEIQFQIWSAWVRPHQDILSTGVGTSLLPLLQCVIAESQTPARPSLIRTCSEQRLSQSTRKDPSESVQLAECSVD